MKKTLVVLALFAILVSGSAFLFDKHYNFYIIDDSNASTGGGGGGDFNTRVFPGANIDVNDNDHDVLISTDADFNSAYARWTDANETFNKKTDSNNVGRLKYQVIADPPAFPLSITDTNCSTSGDCNLFLVRQVDGNIWYNKVLDTNNIGRLLSRTIADLNTIGAIYLPLDWIANPTGSKTFNMANKSLSFSFTNPSNQPTYDGAFEIEGIGAFTGDLFHVHQHVGNPSAGTHLIHAEAEDADVIPISVSGAGQIDINASKAIASYTDINARRDVNVGRYLVLGGVARDSWPSAGGTDTTLDTNRDANASFARKDNNISGTWDFNSRLRAQDVNVRGKFVLGSATPSQLIDGDMNIDGNNAYFQSDVNIRKGVYAYTTQTQGEPSNASITGYCDGGSDYTIGQTIQIRVHAYRTVQGTRIYSLTYAESTAYEIQDDTEAPTLDWTGASQATGYKILRNVDGTGYNSGWDVGTTFPQCDYGSNGGSGWTDGTTVSPTSAQQAEFQGGNLNVQQDTNLAGFLLVGSVKNTNTSAGDINASGNIYSGNRIYANGLSLGTSTAGVLLEMRGTGGMFKLYHSAGGAGTGHPEMRFGESDSIYGSFLWSLASGTYGRSFQVSTVGGAYPVIFGGSKVVSNAKTGINTTTAPLSSWLSVNGDINAYGTSAKLYVGTGKNMQTGLSAGDANFENTIYAQNDLIASDDIWAKDALVTGTSVFVGTYATTGTATSTGLASGDINAGARVIVNGDLNLRGQGKWENLSSTESGSNLFLCITNTGTDYRIYKSTACNVSALIYNAQQKVQAVALSGSYKTYQITYSDFANAEGNPSAFSETYWMTPNLHEIQFIDELKLVAMCLNEQGGVSEIEANVNVVGNAYQSGLLQNADKNYLFAKQGDVIPIQAQITPAITQAVNDCFKWKPVLKSTGYYLRNDENVQSRFQNIDLSYLGIGGLQ